MVYATYPDNVLECALRIPPRHPVQLWRLGATIAGHVLDDLLDAARGMIQRGI